MKQLDKVAEKVERGGYGDFHTRHTTESMMFYKDINNILCHQYKMDKKFVRYLQSTLFHVCDDYGSYMSVLVAMIRCYHEGANSDYGKVCGLK